MSRKIRILLADDSQTIREGLATLLGQERDIEIIGKARDGLEAVELAKELVPDVIIMDLKMPKLEGMEAARIIRTTYPDIRIIALSMLQEADIPKQEWASNYINKTAPLQDLLKAIRGDRAFSQR